MDAADLERIRFVTARYKELQGLRHFAVIGSTLVVFWSRPYLRLLRYMGPVEAIAGFVLSVLPLALVIGAHEWGNRYYARRFGSVALTSGWSRDSLGWLVLLGAAAWLDFQSTAFQRPTAFLLAAAVVSVHVTLRDWPWRGHYLVSAITSAAGAWIAATLQNDGPAPVSAVAMTIGFCGHAVTSYLDHRLLVRSLPHNPDAQAAALAADHADPV